MPPPFRILRPTATPDGVLAAVIPLAAIHSTFPDMPETNYYVVASLTVNADGDWLLFDSNPFHSIRIPKASIHWQCGTSGCLFVYHPPLHHQLLCCSLLNRASTWVFVSVTHRYISNRVAVVS
jgi:hypothetical protein